MRSLPPPAVVYLHGQGGSGFETVDGVAPAQLFDANIPIKIAPLPTGLQYPNVYASEFGCSVFRCVCLCLCVCIAAYGCASSAACRCAG